MGSAPERERVAVPPEGDNGLVIQEGAESTGGRINGSRAREYQKTGRRDKCVAWRARIRSARLGNIGTEASMASLLCLASLIVRVFTRLPALRLGESTLEDPRRAPGGPGASR